MIGCNHFLNENVKVMEVSFGPWVCLVMHKYEVGKMELALGWLKSKRMAAKYMTSVSKNCVMMDIGVGLLFSYI